MGGGGGIRYLTLLSLKCIYSVGSRLFFVRLLI